MFIYLFNIIIFCIYINIDDIIKYSVIFILPFFSKECLKNLLKFSKLLFVLIFLSTSFNIKDPFLK